MKYRRAVGLLNLVREKIEGKNRGERDDTCDHGLSRSWNVEVCKKTTDKNEKKEHFSGRKTTFFAFGRKIVGLLYHTHTSKFAPIYTLHPG